MGDVMIGDSDDVLSLDFANTWGNRRDKGTDRLRSFDELLGWAVEKGIVSDEEAGRLHEKAAMSRADAAAILHRARELREVIYRILSGIAAGRTPAPDEIAVMNRELALALSRLRLRMAESGCCWQWTAEEGALDQMLWPVVRSAAQMLTTELVERVRECAAEDCSWLFVDCSRNRRRRWCDMASCGNRAKARRHYARHRSSEG